MSTRIPRRSLGMAAFALVLAEALRLRPAQRVLYAQTVGHPSEKE